MAPAMATDESTFNLSQYKTENKLEFEAPDGDWKIKIGGRFHLDAAKYFDDDPPSLGSGVEVRRARLSLSGTVKQFWDFKVEYDFVGTGQKKALDDGLKDA
ncbi:MAG: porin, partial [Gammaproteobacteria bacterium]